MVEEVGIAISDLHTAAATLRALEPAVGAGGCL
jgi:hypothetical protein